MVGVEFDIVGLDVVFIGDYGGFLGFRVCCVLG